MVSCSWNLARNNFKEGCETQKPNLISKIKFTFIIYWAGPKYDIILGKPDGNFNFAAIHVTKQYENISPIS